MSRQTAVRVFRADEGTVYRDLRLRALLESPEAFGRTYAEEKDRADDEWTKRLVDWLVSPESLCTLGLVDDQPVGLLFARVDASEGNAAHLYSMWVDPAARRHGIGGLLVDNAVTWSRARGARRMALRVTEDNAAAIALYKRFGFAATAERAPLRADSDLFAIGMELRL